MNASSLGRTCAVLLLVSACSSGGGDPYATGTGGSMDAGGSGNGGAGMDAAGTGGASTDAAGTGGSGSGGAAVMVMPKPARMVVLGDSISGCANVGGPMGADCSVKKLYDYVKATYAPELTYENVSIPGAVSDDVPAKELAMVTPGPGHVLVVIYIGGNNLAKYLFSSDAAAMDGLTMDTPKVLADWDQIFAFFKDTTKFPDGFTMVMNNQYNPFDDCTAAPYNLSPAKNQLLMMFNSALADVAQKNGATLTDQYTPFLGHGHHYAVMTCPHYIPNAVAWMDDLIHPNAAGHTDLFEQWKKTVDRFYGP